MRLEYHPLAYAEYQAAVRWYMRRDPVAARRFASAVDEAIDRILESPSRWRLIDPETRRCRTDVFPYAVIYIVEDDRIRIIAVTHGSRRPGYWKRRKRRRGNPRR